jgi:N-acetylmuramoyl-L-alanine amidase
MKSFIRIIAALVLTVCIAAVPPALVLAAGSDAAFPRSTSSADEMSKVTPDSREITSMAADTGEWQQKADKKWYYYDDGKPCIGWRTINGHMYYFDPEKNGAMVTGFKTIAVNGTKQVFYFSDANYINYSTSNVGQMLTGFQIIKRGDKYYKHYFSRADTSVSIKGQLQTGTKKIDGNLYFFADNRFPSEPAGVMFLGLRTISGKIFYFDSNTGILQTDWASKHVIVIDPGHSADPADENVPIGPGSKTLKEADNIGAKSPYTGLMEYELNLQISLKLRDLLTKRGYKVVMVRTKNSGSYSCIDRAQVANKNNAAIFLRVHANAAPKDHSKNGAMTICITKNNPFTPKTYKQSRQLSDIMLAQYVKATGCYNEGVMETDTMMGNNWSEVPTTLIELGYMTNKKEDALMQTAAYQEKMLSGLVNGIDAYFKATVK